MHWTRWEQDVVSRLIRFPRSTTPRERWLWLLTIRLVLLGATLPLLGVAVVLLALFAGWSVLVLPGVVLYVAGLVLLLLTIALSGCLHILYGD